MSKNKPEVMTEEVVIEEAPAAKATPGTYVAQEGDTWASLGVKFGKGYATAVELMELNGGKALVVGETVRVK